MIRLDPHDALLVIDVQNDFLPGGALAVAHGDEVIPVLNRYLALVQQHGLRVYATRDWHPPGHRSYRSAGGPWAEHCRAQSIGAAFAPALELPAAATIVDKGTAREVEGYSAFDATGLDSMLREAGIERLLAGGLATDYCVLHSVRDARRAGFDVLLLADAIRPVDVKPGDGERAILEMTVLGARVVTLRDFQV